MWESLLNRDDSGLAKRLPYGGVSRTRISSQCLKRHWRKANDPHALEQIGTVSVRSRDLIKAVAEEARKNVAHWNDQMAEALTPWFLFAVYGTKAARRAEEAGREIQVRGQEQPPDSVVRPP